jgi:hypothetical protein
MPSTRGKCGAHPRVKEPARELAWGYLAAPIRVHHCVMGGHGEDGGVVVDAGADAGAVVCDVRPPRYARAPPDAVSWSGSWDEPLRSRAIEDASDTEPDSSACSGSLRSHG